MAYKFRLTTAKPTKIILNSGHLLSGDPEFKLDFIVINNEASDPNDLFEGVKISSKKVDSNTYLVTMEGELYSLFDTPSRQECLGAAEQDEPVAIPSFLVLVGGAQVTPAAIIFGSLEIEVVEEFDEEVV